MTHVQIFSKIESQEGIDNIDEIIKVSDGIMVARGDMGVEIPAEEVPMVQKRIIKKCNAVGKSVITATQMLESMQQNPRPTRARACLTLPMQSLTEQMQPCYLENQQTETILYKLLQRWLVSISKQKML